MLKNTFCHIQRIGTATENKLWSAGIQHEAEEYAIL